MPAYLVEAVKTKAAATLTQGFTVMTSDAKIQPVFTGREGSYF